MSQSSLTGQIGSAWSDRLEYFTREIDTSPGRSAVFSTKVTSSLVTLNLTKRPNRAYNFANGPECHLNHHEEIRSPAINAPQATAETTKGTPVWRSSKKITHPGIAASA